MTSQEKAVGIQNSWEKCGQPWKLPLCVCVCRFFKTVGLNPLAFTKANSDIDFNGEEEATFSIEGHFFVWLQSLRAGTHCELQQSYLCTHEKHTHQASPAVLFSSMKSQLSLPPQFNATATIVRASCLYCSKFLEPEERDRCPPPSFLHWRYIFSPHPDPYYSVPGPQPLQMNVSWDGVKPSKDGRKPLNKNSWLEEGQRIQKETIGQWLEMWPL